MRAFWLNFDADGELAGQRGSTKPVPNAVACRLLRARVSLVPREDHVLTRESRVDPATIERVVCWMPTPRALAAITQLGLTAPRAPRFEVLRAVNSRRFSCLLGAGPPGTRWVESEAELVQVLAQARGDSWLRRAHGFAGRGRHIASAGAVTAATTAFARAALAADGGFELAPRVEVRAEFALHGFVGGDGLVTLGQPVRSHVDSHGQWRRSSIAPADALTASERGALFAAAERAGRELFAAGYFGPFGVDAMRWQAGAERGFCAFHEINARYTMSWGRGMKGLRVDLD